MLWKRDTLWRYRFWSPFAMAGKRNYRGQGSSALDGGLGSGAAQMAQGNRMCSLKTHKITVISAFWSARLRQ